MKRAPRPRVTELQSWSTNSSLHSPEKLQEFGEATVLALERTLGMEMENMGGEADELVAAKGVIVSPEDDAMKSSQSSKAMMLFRVDRGIKNRRKDT